MLCCDVIKFPTSNFTFSVPKWPLAIFSIQETKYIQIPPIRILRQKIFRAIKSAWNCCANFPRCFACSFKFSKSPILLVASSKSTRYSACSLSNLFATSSISALLL